MTPYLCSYVQVTGEELFFDKIDEREREKQPWSTRKNMIKGKLKGGGGEG